MNMIQLHDFQMILLLLWVFQPNQFDTIPAFLSAKSSRIVGGPPCNFTVGHEWNHQQGTKHHRIIDYPYSNNSWEQNQCPWRSCNFRYVVHIRNDDRVGFPFLQWQGANYNRFWTLGLHLCKISQNRSPNATSNPMIKNLYSTHGLPKKQANRPLSLLASWTPLWSLYMLAPSSSLPSKLQRKETHSRGNQVV